MSLHDILMNLLYGLMCLVAYLLVGWLFAFIYEEGEKLRETHGIMRYERWFSWVESTHKFWREHRKAYRRIVFFGWAPIIVLTILAIVLYEIPRHMLRFLNPSTKDLELPAEQPEPTNVAPIRPKKRKFFRRTG